MPREIITSLGEAFIHFCRRQEIDRLVGATATSYGNFALRNILESSDLMLTLFRWNEAEENSPAAVAAREAQTERLWRAGGCQVDRDGNRHWSLGTVDPDPHLMPPEPLFNLTELWRQAGEPEGLEPSAVVPGIVEEQGKYAESSAIVEDRGAGGPWADFYTAALYVWELDPENIDAAELAEALWG
jgi:hypothetical protein